MVRTKAGDDPMCAALQVSFGFRFVESCYRGSSPATTNDLGGTYR